LLDRFKLAGFEDMIDRGETLIEEDLAMLSELREKEQRYPTKFVRMGSAN
jgi:hypothetical protein